MIFNFLLKMTQLASDIVFRDLKERGLALSPISKLVIPDAPPKEKSMVSMLASMLTRRVEEPVEDKIIIFPILNSVFLVARQRMLYVYKYSILDSTCEIEIAHSQTILLPYNIEAIYSCDPKFTQDRGDVPLLIRGPQGLTFFLF